MYRYFFSVGLSYKIVQLLWRICCLQTVKRMWLLYKRYVYLKAIVLLLNFDLMAIFFNSWWWWCLAAILLLPNQPYKLSNMCINLHNCFVRNSWHISRTNNSYYMNVISKNVTHIPLYRMPQFTLSSFLVAVCSILLDKNIQCPL